MQRALLIGLIALTASVGCASSEETDGAERSPATVTSATTATGELVARALPRPVHERCSTRSEAEFGGAFHDPENLVAGPFVLVGGARLTTAEVLASHDGQKFPVLVRAGKRVTVRVPEGVRDYVSLGYGPLPQGNVEYADGHPAVTFTACPPGGPSSSSAGPGEPVTFWSGFVFATQPSCAPLDVYVDGESSPRRLEIPLGAPC
jgi:hypothetical protein